MAASRSARVGTSAFGSITPLTKKVGVPVTLSIWVAYSRRFWRSSWAFSSVMQASNWASVRPCFLAISRKIGLIEPPCQRGWLLNTSSTMEK